MNRPHIRTVGSSGPKEPPGMGRPVAARGHTVSISPARMMTEVVPSPTSSSCARLSSIMCFAAGWFTSISRGGRRPFGPSWEAEWLGSLQAPERGSG